MSGPEPCKGEVNFEPIKTSLKGKVIIDKDTPKWKPTSKFRGPSNENGELGRLREAMESILVLCVEGTEVMDCVKVVRRVEKIAAEALKR